MLIENRKVSSLIINFALLLADTPNRRLTWPRSLFRKARNPSSLALLEVPLSPLLPFLPSFPSQTSWMVPHPHQPSPIAVWRHMWECLYPLNANYTCNRLPTHLLSIRQSQVKTSTIIKLSSHPKFSTNSKTSHWQWNASNLLWVTILILQIRNLSTLTTLSPFINWIFSLCILLALPCPFVYLFLGCLYATFLYLLKQTWNTVRPKLSVQPREEFSLSEQKIDAYTVKVFFSLFGWRLSQL